MEGVVQVLGGALAALLPGTAVLGAQRALRRRRERHAQQVGLGHQCLCLYAF